MIDTPHITHSEARITACIHLVVPATEIHLVMGPAIRELYAAVAAQGIAPTGPWFTHHARRPQGTFDFEASIPIASPIAPVGRVKHGVLAATRVARTVYHGGYEGLGAGWGAFMEWIEANELEAREDLWECYTVGPEAGPDASLWRTELNRPLVD